MPWARVMTSTDAWTAAATARRDARAAEGKPFTGILTGNLRADQDIQAMVAPGGEPWRTAVAKMYEANASRVLAAGKPRGCRVHHGDEGRGERGAQRAEEPRRRPA